MSPGLDSKLNACGQVIGIAVGAIFICVAFGLAAWNAWAPGLAGSMMWGPGPSSSDWSMFGIALALPFIVFPTAATLMKRPMQQCFNSSKRREMLLFAFGAFPYVVALLLWMAYQVMYFMF